jgi:hypothetical protein
MDMSLHLGEAACVSRIRGNLKLLPEAAKQPTGCWNHRERDPQWRLLLPTAQRG